LLYQHPRPRLSMAVKSRWQGMYSGQLNKCTMYRTCMLFGNNAGWIKLHSSLFALLLLRHFPIHNSLKFGYRTGIRMLSVVFSFSQLPCLPRFSRTRFISFSWHCYFGTIELIICHQKNNIYQITITIIYLKNYQYYELRIYLQSNF
jgi:hypothetical protein